MSIRILAIDDELDMLELLEVNLSREGYRVKKATNVSEALCAIQVEKPDLILLDIMLPDTSGIKLLEKLKKDTRTAGIPVIMLTAKDKDTDIIVALRLGADDYVTKPFSTDVLIARIEAVLRRFHTGTADDVTQFGPIQISSSRYQVFANDKPVELTVLEFRIMQALLHADGAVLSREEIAARAGVEKEDFNPRAIDVHIAAIRRKIAGCEAKIKTIRGMGYQLGLLKN
ncbi:MAG: response regulator transcription factor [Planctomycetota bacterium]